MVKFVNNSNKDSKDTNRIPKGKNLKISSKKNIPPNTNTINEIQASKSDQSIESDDNKNDPMG